MKGWAIRVFMMLEVIDIVMLSELCKLFLVESAKGNDTFSHEVSFLCR